MKIKFYKHRIPDGLMQFGVSVQQDMCCENIGYWWPDWSVAVWWGEVLYVFAKTQDEM